MHIDTVKWVFTGLGSWLLGFLMPVAGFVGMITFLVIVDLYSGVKAAQHRKEKITSTGFKRTVGKITLYFCAILAARGIDTVFLLPKGHDLDVTWVVAGFIAMTEFKSLLENIYTVTGVDVWKEIADILPSLKQKKK